MFGEISEEFTLDELDNQIVKALQRDGRVSYTELADQLDTTASTVRNRIQRLTDQNFIKVVGVVNPFMTGMGTVAFVGLSIDFNHYDSIVEKIKQIPEARFIAGSGGKYDLFVQVITPTNTEFYDILRKQIGVIDGVESLDTHMLFEIHKQTYDWGTGVNLNE
ncbi:Lrp/AsnC family transcriptional regulator [Aquisalibacillus elongatus]|uniref:Lrp/AsnC family transcriptional regulator for asnA, asnC and gidA n=1 Tax=Aquisalibacillus elongatus TaxID=485577 RepID=A0A3N5BA20_9BACI|nr:Lrp/AsnC family transcriptional regulator [Aquisalibacillus elongatus]RPF54227.1 Lrp/AsnC family transcriptional regulator for asnA, asnC and gidA [Aquisalibacillus elongatus]